MGSDVPFWDLFNVTDGKVFAPGSEGFDYDETSPWSQLTLKGNRLPGTITLTGSATHRIDVQKSNGVDGGTLIERGYVPGKFDIDMKIWTESHWDLWKDIYPQIFRRPAKVDVNDAKTKKAGATATQIDVTSKAALPISHPVLDLMGISSCLVESIAMPRPGPELGTQIITIKCIEYVPPTKKSAIRKTTGAAVNVGLAKELQPAVNKPISPAEAGDGSPGGPPVTSHGSR